MDAAPADVRFGGVEREMQALGQLGFVGVELDLRDYFNEPDRLAADLGQFDVAWFRGGNCFMLRYALARSGGDRVLLTQLENDAIVYAGYSAGPCVLAPSLKGLDLVDEPHDVEENYEESPIWDGLGVLSFAFVPHFESPGHPESEAMNNVVAHYEANGTPYKTLRDGEVLVVHGEESTLFM